MPHSQDVQTRRVVPAAKPVLKPEAMKPKSVSKILVIEDDPDIKYPLMLRLEHLGYEVCGAADGRDGLFSAITLQPDVIILDLFLPSLSGEEICKSVREHEDPAVARIPIIMVTAKGSQADQIVGRMIGANSYLTKPFEFEDLLKELYKIIPALDRRETGRGGRYQREAG